VASNNDSQPSPAREGLPGSLSTGTRAPREFVVGRAEEFADGDKKIVDVGKRSIGVYYTNGEFYAVLNKCPHALAPICLAPVSGTNLPSAPGEFIYGMDGFVIRCPWHQWEFDVRTGASVFGVDSRRIPTFPVRVEDGSVIITLRVREFASEPA
jgi:nitrite reductase (NADH) small subunit